MLESVASGCTASEAGIGGSTESSYRCCGTKGSTEAAAFELAWVLLAEMTGLEGSGVVADEVPEEEGEVDENPLTSNPLSEGAFEDEELDGVEAIILQRIEGD